REGLSQKDIEESPQLQAIAKEKSSVSQSIAAQKELHEAQEDAQVGFWKWLTTNSSVRDREALRVKRAEEAVKITGQGGTIQGDNGHRSMGLAGGGFESYEQTFQRIQQQVGQVDYQKLTADYTRQTADNTKQIAEATMRQNGQQQQGAGLRMAP